MKSHLTVEKALKKLYNRKVRAVVDISSNWSLFQPYRVGEMDLAYYKLVQISNSYHTSPQIQSIALNKFSQHLHDVKVILVQRCFQCSYFLIKSDKNIISLKNLIQLRRDSSELIEKEIIYKFLQFISLLQKYQISNLSLQEIGLTFDGKFILTKYLLFFKTKETIENTFTQDVQKLLASMILLDTSEKLNFDELFSICLQNYGQQLLQIVKKTISYNFSTDDVLTYIQSVRSTYQYEKKSTLTDSFNSYNGSQIRDENIMDESFISSDTYTESLVKAKKTKKLNKKALVSFLLILVVAIGVAAYVTLKFLGNHHILCEEAQYLNQNLNKCLSCPMNCSKCESGQLDSCLSCREGKVLIIRDEKTQIGECSSSEDCKGSFIKQNICFDPVK